MLPAQNPAIPGSAGGDLVSIFFTNLSAMIPLHT
jgi:hypothetical protein